MKVIVTTVVMVTVAWHLACVAGASGSNRAIVSPLSVEDEEDNNQEDALSFQLPSLSSGLEKQLLGAIARAETAAAAEQRMKLLLESVASRSGSSAEYETRKRSPYAGQQQGRRYDAYGVAGRFGKRNL